MWCAYTMEYHTALKILAFSEAAMDPEGVVLRHRMARMTEGQMHSVQFTSVAQSCPTLCDPMNLTQHAWPPCPSPAAGVHSDSHPSSPWCHPAIASWVVPFSSCPQSLPASGSFPMSPLYAWGGQSTGASALASSWSLISEIQERKQMNKNSNMEAEL